MARKTLLTKVGQNIVSTLTIISALLIIANGILIGVNGFPIIISSTDPNIMRINTWEEFASRAQEAKMVSIMYNPPSTDLIVEASTRINVSETEQENVILTFYGTFPPTGYSGPSEKEDLKTWISEQLQVDPNSAYTDRILSIESINNTGFWWRITLGLPGLVENGMAYAWISLAVLLLLMGVIIRVKPTRTRSWSIWVVVISLLSTPIGGGFFIGAILGFIAGLAGIHGNTSLEQTFIGRILNVLRLSKKTMAEILNDKRRIQTAVLTIIFVGILSSFGAVLYAYNVNTLYSGSTTSILKSTYAILINGAIFIDTSVYFGAISYITISVIKWLILSIILYLAVSRLLTRELSFEAIAAVAAYAYVPELIQTFTPVLFTNEPFLSKGMSIGFSPIPITWPLTLFLISRLWTIVILTIAISNMIEVPKSKAFGITLFSGTIYFFFTYLILYNQVNIPGFIVKFSASEVAVLMATSIALIIAILLGALKKES
ncbi:MAG: hypothetical protein ACPLW8_03420 [Candidatus Bathyarchaeales archaeon]